MVLIKFSFLLNSYFHIFFVVEYRSEVNDNVSSLFGHVVHAKSVVVFCVSLHCIHGDTTVGGAFQGCLKTIIINPLIVFNNCEVVRPSARSARY